jgi:hypothetical protein
MESGAKNPCAFLKLDPSFHCVSFRMTPIFRNKLLAFVMLSFLVILNEVKNP